MGKTAGRWTKEEHKKFVQGKTRYLISFISLSIMYSYQIIREGLEESGGLREDKVGCLDQIARPEVLHQNPKETQEWRGPRLPQPDRGPVQHHTRPRIVQTGHCHVRGWLAQGRPE